jgi:addiction module RelE/StbE family toxin
MRIVWTGFAVRDLASARAYIAQDNPPATDRQVRRVLAAVASLLQFPEIGRPGRRAGTRELVVDRTPYIVAYRLLGDTIELLRVMHSRQRWPDSLQPSTTTPNA